MRAKKSLGQHFLTSQHVLKKIITAANLRPSDTVLEIGPGKGILTKALLQTAARVVAVEKDAVLAAYLADIFSHQISDKQLTLVSGDILDFDLSLYKLTPGTYKVVANIPYYITGVFFRRFLSSATYPESMTLLVQKEVAERIIAKTGKESLFSISVKVYGTPKQVGVVRAGNFSPPPKVDSAILTITDISKSQFNDIDEQSFFTVLHAGFAHKRKQLATNFGLANMLAPEKMCTHCTIPPSVRAEDLSVRHWICLAQAYRDTK